ncbi:MAG TPA: IS1634 family transposase [Syntrophobacteraceae bacterium]|nr:IS1634 family transposase [Syntrophobacteraceae bacterium]
MVEYYQLAHNVRHAKTGSPVAEIIHNFGRADELDRDDLVRLCRSIARVCGVEVHDPLERVKTPVVDDRPPALPEDVKLIRTVELGVPLVVETLWERLKLGPTLRKAMEESGGSDLHERALLAMTANRLSDPDSKLGVWDRWLHWVYLPSCSAVKLYQMYEALDLLNWNVRGVEDAVFFHIANLFNLVVDVIFYDTTTASFSIDEEDEDTDSGTGFRKYGHCKDGTWSPQIVVALAVTREGLPVRSWVFPGNTSDVDTVKKVREDLRGWKLGRALFVADSGMNCGTNRDELAKACGKYLLATRMGSVSGVKEDVLTRPGRFRTIAENLQAKEVIVGDGVLQRRYILCYNPREAQRERKHREQVVKELEEELKTHPDHQATARWAIDLLASGRYKRYLRIDKQNRIRLDREAIEQASKHDGKWVLQTNDDTITVEDAAAGYKGLLVIERTFKTLKSTRIKMEPMYHWLPKRIEAHVKLCVFSLLIERVVELECKRPWSHIQRTLSTLQATEFRTEKNLFFQRNEPTLELVSILKSLKIPMPKAVLDIKSISSKT